MFLSGLATFVKQIFVANVVKLSTWTLIQNSRCLCYLSLYVCAMKLHFSDVPYFVLARRPKSIKGQINRFFGRLKTRFNFVSLRRIGQKTDLGVRG